MITEFNVIYIAYGAVFIIISQKQQIVKFGVTHKSYYISTLFSLRLPLCITFAVFFHKKAALK